MEVSDGLLFPNDSNHLCVRDTIPRFSIFKRKRKIVMKTYKIFKNPTGQYEAVKQGWSWPAFFFAGIWVCVKKMWGLGIGIIIVFIILNVMAGDNEVMNVLVSILSLGVGIVLGMQGNKLREGNLKKRGYQEVPQVIQAGNPEAAVAQYISEYEKN